MSGKGCANSGPGGLGVPEMTQRDGPGVSLCAAPLELSGPGFQGVWQRLDEPVEVRRYTGPEFVGGDLESEGRRQDCQLSWGWGS